MSLFVLNQGYRVVATKTGGRVVHERTGDALLLTPAEIQVLARASSGGLDAADPALHNFVKKFAGLKVLVKAAEEAPESLKSPESAPEKTARAPLQPTQTVPCFRGDLKIARKAQGATIDVTDPTNGKTFPLYDFEVSLARMLDGRRTIEDVIDDGQRLGIPIDLDSLGQFLRQLERYGFLAAAGTTAPPSDASRTPRRKWDEGVRTLFQSGLRTFRRGRYSQALAYFEAILLQDPENSEAREMLEQARQFLTIAAPQSSRFTELPDLDGDLAPLNAVAPTAPPPVPQPAVPVQQKSVKKEEAPSPPLAPPPPEAPAVPAANEPIVSAPQAAQPPPSETPAPEQPTHPPFVTHRSRRRALLAASAALIIAAGVGAASFTDLPALVGLGKPVGPPPVAKVAPHPVPKATPTHDIALEPLPGATPTAPAVAEAQTPKPDAGEQPAPSAPMTVEQSDKTAQQDVHEAPVPAPAAAWLITSKIDRRGRVKMGELVAPAAGTISWSAALEQRVARKELVGTLQSSTGKSIPLLVPKSGLFFPSAKNGQEVAQGEIVATFPYHEAFLQTVVVGERPQTSWRCEVADEDSGKSAPCHVVSAVPRGAGFFVTATVEPTWFDKAADPRLRLAPP